MHACMHRPFNRSPPAAFTPPLQDGAAANVRAKAIKAIGAAIDRDVAVLGLPDVQAAVREALHDDSVSVREAAVDLFGRCVGRGGRCERSTQERVRTYSCIEKQTGNNVHSLPRCMRD